MAASVEALGVDDGISTLRSDMSLLGLLTVIPIEDSRSLTRVSGWTGTSPTGDRKKHSPSFSTPSGSGVWVGSHKESRSLSGAGGEGPGSWAETGHRGLPRKTFVSIRRGIISGVSHRALSMVPWRMEATRV